MFVRLPYLLALAGALVLVSSARASGSRSAGSSTRTTARGGASQATPGVTVADAYTSVVASVLGPPTFPFLGTDQRYHVVYDLEFQNASTVPAALHTVEVLDAADPAKVLVAYEGDALVRRLRTLAGDRGIVPNAEIEPSAGRIFYVELVFDSLGQAPQVVLHHLSALGAANPAAQDATPIDYTITPYNISAGVPLVLGPPVAGKGWVALNGCCAPGFPHRPSVAPFNGELINSQRFALDWKRMNEEGAFYVGDRTRNESYVDYGADVLAVADGTVVATLDSLEPNEPGILPANDPTRAPLLTVQTVDGNHIVLDLGNGTFAFYAHLQKGTLRVQPGDTVKQGDTLAKLGNTGNSNASHLHFHLMDGPSELGSHGVPYVIGGFDYAGQVPLEVFAAADDYLTGHFGQQRLPTPQPRTDELPLNLAIVDFPE